MNASVGFSSCAGSPSSQFTQVQIGIEVAAPFVTPRCERSVFEVHKGCTVGATVFRPADISSKCSECPANSSPARERWHKMPPITFSLDLWSKYSPWHVLGNWFNTRARPCAFASTQSSASESSRVRYGSDLTAIGRPPVWAESQRTGIACCSSKQDSRFLRSIATRDCEPSGAALRYWTGHEIGCPSARAARKGQYGSRRSSRAMMTASACPVTITCSA
jgi:hypothetical protein